MVATLFGMAMLVRLLHKLNAESPMLIRFMDKVRILLPMLQVYMLVDSLKTWTATVLLLGGTSYHLGRAI